MLLKSHLHLRQAVNISSRYGKDVRKYAMSIVITSLFLFGCEAPLVMDNVTAQLDQAVQRTDFYQAFASNNSTAILVGSRGVVLTSNDAVSWSRTVLDTNPSFLAIDACPDQRFIALSFDNRIWVSSPSGDDWSSVQVDTQEQLMTIDCAPNGDWWVAGGFSTFLSSSDNGQSWRTSSLDEDAIITNVSFLTEVKAVATAEFGLLMVTENSGDTWEIRGFIPEEFYPHAVHFTSTTEGWVGGLNGFIYYTNDSGSTWQKQDTNSNAPIYEFEEVDGVLFAIGDNATVLQLNENKWTVVQSASAPIYLRAALSFKQQLLVAGGRGNLLAITPNAMAFSIENNGMTK